MGKNRIMTNGGKLPEGWEWKTLGDIVQKSKAKATPAEYPEAKFIGMDCIESNSLRPSFLYDFKDFKSSGNYFLKGQVLYGRMRPYLNKVYRADFEGACSGEFIVLDCNSTLLPDYLKYILHSRDFVRFATDQTSGDRPRVTFEDIAGYPVFLPPLPEQERIVSKIEELFSELEKGKEQILLAQQQLKTYRQAVLKWAFEGRLTSNRTYTTNGEPFLEFLRQKNIDALRQDINHGHEEAARILKKSSRTKTKTSPENNSQLPSYWVTASLIEACLYVVDCHNKTAPYVESGTHLIRTSNIKNGKLKLDENIRFVDDSTYLKWSKRCPPKENDILFTREAPMGESAIVPQGIKVCMGQRMMLLRTVGEVLLPKYLHYAILEPNFQKRLEAASIGTGVKHLRVGDVEQQRIPICSTEEQRHIVQEIESRLSVCDALEATLQTSLAQAEVLRQSILKRAFEGRLVNMENSYT